MDLPDFVKESVAQIQILCTFQAHVVSQAHAAKGRRARRETRALALTPGEKPVRSERARGSWSAMQRDVAGERRSPKAIFVSVDLLHKIFTTRKDELVKDLPAT